jgi:hypothetical protein
MFDLVSNKTHNEARQGEALVLPLQAGSPVARRFYIESYGCAMNFADSEIVASILNESGFGSTGNFEEADLFLTDNHKIKILITGNRKWINIYFPQKAPTSLADLGMKLPGPAGRLQLHNNIRTVGLSLHPSHETSSFIASLSEGMINSKDKFISNEFEISLLEAGGLPGFWTVGF